MDAQHHLLQADAAPPGGPLPPAPQPAASKEMSHPHPNTPGHVDLSPVAPDPAAGTPNPVASATAATMDGTTMAAVMACALACGRKEPATAFLAGTRASGARLRRRRGEEELWRVVAAALGRGPPVSPSREDDAGA